MKPSERIAALALAVSVLALCLSVATSYRLFIYSKEEVKAVNVGWEFESPAFVLTVAVANHGTHDCSLVSIHPEVWVPEASTFLKPAAGGRWLKTWFAVPVARLNAARDDPERMRPLHDLKEPIVLRPSEMQVLKVDTLFRTDDSNPFELLTRLGGSVGKPGFSTLFFGVTTQVACATGRVVEKTFPTVMLLFDVVDGHSHYSTVAFDAPVNVLDSTTLQPQR